jgi:hypothetical protein
MIKKSSALQGQSLQGPSSEPRIVHDPEEERRKDRKRMRERALAFPVPQWPKS